MSSDRADIEVAPSSGAIKAPDDRDESANKRRSTGSEQKEKNTGITAMGLKVLVLLAVQNSSKNLLMRFVMKEKPQFLTSAAVIGSGTPLTSLCSQRSVSTDEFLRCFRMYKIDA